MAELTFRPLDESGMRLYATWFDDAELSRRIEAPTPRWFEYVTNTPGIYAWMVYDGDEAVGSAQLDAEAGGIGYCGLAVRPARRNLGYGARILRELLRRPEALALRQLEARVEPDNVAALRCCQRAGFAPVSAQPDDEGFVQFTYTIRSQPASPPDGAPR